MTIRFWLVTLTLAFLIGCSSQHHIDESIKNWMLQHPDSLSYRPPQEVLCFTNGYQNKIGLYVHHIMHTQSGTFYDTVDRNGNYLVTMRVLGVSIVYENGYNNPVLTTTN